MADAKMCACGHEPHEGRCLKAWILGESSIACPCNVWVKPIPNVDTTATRTVHDPVSSPAHYTRFPGGVQPIDLIEHLPYNLGAAAKYILRAGHKGDLAEDLRKSIWYLERELKRVAK